MNVFSSGNAFPAFPIPANEPIHSSHPGMSLRDYFAAQALQGLIAHTASDTHGNIELVTQAYNLADAMLEARQL